VAAISAIRSGLATQLATITGLRTNSTGTIPDNVNPPYAIVQISTVDYHKAFNNALNTYNFVVTVVVGRVDERTAQRSLDTYCTPSGASSIRGAIEANRTLGGVVFDTIVTGMRNYGSVTIGDTNYLAAEFDIAVQAD
jgi:hypothetical protein